MLILHDFFINKIQHIWLQLRLQLQERTRNLFLLQSKQHYCARRGAIACSPQQMQYQHLQLFYLNLVRFLTK